MKDEQYETIITMLATNRQELQEFKQDVNARFEAIDARFTKQDNHISNVAKEILSAFNDVVVGIIEDARRTKVANNKRFLRIER